MEEPVRKSFYDVYKGRVKLSDRAVVSSRFVCIGEYKGSHGDLKNKIRSSVNALNGGPGGIVLTGLLLVYPKYFVHLIEASEETIYRHFQDIFANDGNESLLGRVIPLPTYHNVYRMYFSTWRTTYLSSPPLLLDKITNVEMDEIQKQIKECLLKVYSLCEHLMDMNCESQEKCNNVIKTLDKTLQHYLPEVTRIEYLLGVRSRVIEDLRVYLKKFNEIPFIHFYNDRVWPPVRGMIPKDDTPHSSRRVDERLRLL